MRIEASGDADNTVFFRFPNDSLEGLKEYLFNKDELKLIFTAISGLYGVGWMDGKHCKTVELTYTLDDINKSLAEYQREGLEKSSSELSLKGQALAETQGHYL